jgi:hypothetical protein
MQFAEDLRRFTVLVGTVSAFGIAEQHLNPVPAYAAIPGSSWPTADLPSWAILNIAAALLCLAGFMLWYRKPVVLRLAAVFYASVIWARGIALLSAYGWDLWGTVARNLLTSLLVVVTWSWTGGITQAIDRAAGDAETRSQ